MVVLSGPTLEQISLIRNHKPTFCSHIPTIDLSKPDSKNLIVKACEEFGFFKVINHSIPSEFMDRLETQATNFFSLPTAEKEKVGLASPFGYANKRIGPNGDMGWVEYILISLNEKFISQKSLDFFGEKSETFGSCLSDYISAVKKLACEVLELLAEELEIKPRNSFSKLLMDEESDSVFRLNHYQTCPELQGLNCNLIGFGEHTDPQVISVLRSNDTTGLQISLRDGSWVSVPPDQSSFFIFVGDSLQVLTNGRFRSVKHRVLTNSHKSRVSMIYFGAPALREEIVPLPMLMAEGEESLYKEFTWCEYKNTAYKSRLADDRLGFFLKQG
ncbi:gibberellin 2-beta-dioxygenase 1-like [Tasmannia lanceolata]|uniref:gibberellin 2-beta-dioxygenase 1-like n=1 Tax=Tasmannia lanceolata TaxID=3420 RepID=UPI004063389D